MGSAKPARRFNSAMESAARADLDAAQWRAFERHLEMAWRTPFYREKFEAAGMSPSDVRGLDDVRRLPLTTKQDICEDLASHPPYGSRMAASGGKVVSVVETSGTSGKGKEVYAATAEDIDRIIEMESTGFVWAGIRPGTVVALTIPITMTAASTWWNLSLHALKANHLRVGHLTTDQKLRYMIRYRAEVIIATPTYLGRLEHRAQEMGLDVRRELSHLRSVIVAGEARSAAWAQEREQLWGATLSEQWGCTQGAVAWSCETGMAPSGRPGLLHGLPHLTLMEVIHPGTGLPVADGEFGELVITPLGVTGAALIRFATGDRVRFRTADHCSCGRPFDGLEAGSVTRYDDMMKVKGINVWPSAVSAVIEPYRAVAEYWVTVGVASDQREALTVEIDFQVGTSAHAREVTIHGVARDLQTAIGLSVEVSEWRGSVTLADEVLAGTPWKAKRFRDLRTAQNQPMDTSGGESEAANGTGAAAD